MSSCLWNEITYNWNVYSLTWGEYQEDISFEKRWKELVKYF
jgi:hypothetical protein